LKRLVDGTGAYWEAESDGCLLRSESGAPGKRPRIAEKSFPNPKEAADAYEKQALKKLREGYVYRGEGTASSGPWALKLQVAVSAVHTGFQAMDYLPEEGLVLCSRPHQGREAVNECELLYVDLRTGAVAHRVALPFFDLMQIVADPTRGCVYLRDDEYRQHRLDRQTDRVEQLGRSSFRGEVAFSLSADGGRLLMADAGRAVVTDLVTGNQLIALDIPRDRDLYEKWTGALTADGSVLALCRAKGRIELFRVEDGQPFQLMEGDFPCAERLAFHPSRRYLAMQENQGPDYGFRLWETATGTEMDRFSPVRLADGDRGTRDSHTFDFSHEGRHIAIRHALSVLVCDFETGKHLQRIRPEFAVGANTAAFAIRFSPRDDTLLIRTNSGIISVYQTEHSASGPSD
jgi:hypothetical protein